MKMIRTLISLGGGKTPFFPPPSGLKSVNFKQFHVARNLMLYYVESPYCMWKDVKAYENHSIDHKIMISHRNIDFIA